MFSRQLGRIVGFRMTYGNEGSRSISQASARGRVKWFNPTKGYGFITLDNGGDAFCHASALQATGHADVPPGTTIVCDLADSQRGLQVVAVHSVDTTTAEAPSRGPRRDFDREGGADEEYFEDEFSTPRHEPRRREEPVAEEAGEEAVEGRRGSEGAEGDEYDNAENPFTRPARAAKPRRR